MSHSIQTLVDIFAIRSFRDTADKDYITARMAYRAQLIQPYRWSALHCLEKYIKGILLLNRLNTKDLGHRVLLGIERMKEKGKFPLDISANSINFIRELEESGADDRYYLLSYDIERFDVVRLDLAVWELRRYCQQLDRNRVDITGKTENVLNEELERIHQAKNRHEKGTCITGGVLERIIAKQAHPARDALIWKNLNFGPSRRKSIKMREYWEAGNSPFFLNPEILEEVLKYVKVHPDIRDGVRQFAHEEALKMAKVQTADSKNAVD